VSSLLAFLEAPDCQPESWYPSLHLVLPVIFAPVSVRWILPSLSFSFWSEFCSGLVFFWCLTSSISVAGLLARAAFGPCLTYLVASSFDPIVRRASFSVYFCSLLHPRVLAASAGCVPVSGGPASQCSSAHAADERHSGWPATAASGGAYVCPSSPSSTLSHNL
jgi:hypothetical protein